MKMTAFLFSSFSATGARSSGVGGLYILYVCIIHTYVYIRMCVYVYVCMYIHAHTHTHTQIHICTQTHKYTSTHTHILLPDNDGRLAILGQLVLLLHRRRLMVGCDCSRYPVKVSLYVKRVTMYCILYRHTQTHIHIHTYESPCAVYYTDIHRHTHTYTYI